MAFNWKAVSSRLKKTRSESSHVWDHKPDGLSPDVGTRENPGLRRNVRESYTDFRYRGALPQESRPLPYGVETWIKDIFGERAKDLKFVFSGYLKRWTLWEKHRQPEMGSDNIWQCIWVCCEAPEENTIPTDYVGDRLLTSYYQQIGEFKLPTRLDFEEIELTDHKKYGVNAVNDHFDKFENVAEKGREKEWSDAHQDLLDYFWEQEVNLANREAGSGWKMQSYATVDLFSNNSVWYKAKRNGYTSIIRKGTREYFIERASEICQEYNNYPLKDWMKSVPYGLNNTTDLLKDMVEKADAEEVANLKAFKLLEEEVQTPEFKRKLALALEAEQQKLESVQQDLRETVMVTV